jgi:hypothetical protein
LISHLILFRFIMTDNLPIRAPCKQTYASNLCRMIRISVNILLFYALFKLMRLFFILIVFNFKSLNVIAEIYLINLIILIFVYKFFAYFLNIHKTYVMLIHRICYFFMEYKLNPFNRRIVLIYNAFKSNFMSSYIHFLLVI